MPGLQHALILLPLLCPACSSDPVPSPTDLAIADTTVTDHLVRPDRSWRDGGLTCDEVKAELEIAIELAKVCQPQAATKQCTRMIKQDKLPCGCPIYINPANSEAVAQADEQLSAWRRKSCGAKIDCKTCATPSSGTCEATPPNSKVPGLCKSVF
jgi:hypothetical protein